MRNECQRGQVLLISLLVLSVATTVALSLIGRSTTDVSISNQTNESSRAFSAAEAGIEESLKTGLGSSEQTLSGAKYTVSKADVGNAAGVYKFPKKISKGTTATLWLAKHDMPDGSLNTDSGTYSGSSIDVCWSQETTIPAMIVSILYKTAGGEYRVSTGAYDPIGSRLNYFSTPVTSSSGGCGDGTGTTYKKTIDLSAIVSEKLLMLRLQPVYSDATLAVNASSALPIQGKKLESTGTSGAGVTRKVVVYQQYRSPPSIFDSVIYSQGSFGR